MGRTSSRADRHRPETYGLRPRRRSRRGAKSGYVTGLLTCYPSDWVLIGWQAAKPE